MLTDREKLQLEALAEKAGIKIPRIPKPMTTLSKKEIRRIERAFDKHGAVVVLVRKKTCVRVFSKDSHNKMGLGLTALHLKKKGEQ